jgi:quercetin dioxygenase-like cupin family protein
MSNKLRYSMLLCGLLGAGVQVAAGATEPPAAGFARALAVSPDDPSLNWSACPPLVFAPGCQLAVLRGDPAQPNADVLLRVPGGYRIAPHTHTSAERMILLSGQLEVQYAGNPAVTLEVGDYAYGPPGLAHQAKCLDTTPCTLFIAFELPVDALPFDGAVD